MSNEMQAEGYNDFYKYGYDWSEYNKMGEDLCHIMFASGAKDKRILDIGCGLGWFCDLMYFNVSKDITGIDFSNIAINFHAKNLYPCCKLEVASAYEYDYTGYDVFTAMETLEHLDDLKIIEKVPIGKQFYGTVPLNGARACPQHLRDYTLESLKERYKDLLDIKYCEPYEGMFIIFHGVRK